MWAPHPMRALTMEQGVDGILMNTALAEASDPVAMAHGHASRGRGRSLRVPGRPDASPRSRDAIYSGPRNAGVGPVGHWADKAIHRPRVSPRRSQDPRRRSPGATFRSGARPRDRKLPEPDRRLAHELAAGVLRQRSVLDQKLAPLVPRGWDAVTAELQDILRLGAYQLTALERVPPHAAVDTSVSLARGVGGARAAGFVNAVLRRLTRSVR